MIQINKKIFNELTKLNLEKNSSPTFLLAVSGGLDSIVMLDVFFKLSNKEKFTIFVSHINYQLHNNSNTAEALIKKYCTKNLIQYEIVRADINNSSNFEAKARKFRYDVFQKLIEKYNIKYICTAHHWDDQLETLYMKYIQNAPLTSYRGVLELNKNIWRPLLKFSKNEILEFAIKNNLNWIEDTTNDDKNYLRNKIRIEDIPKLKINNPKLITELFQKKDQILRLFEIAEFTKAKLFSSKLIILNLNPIYFMVEINSILKLDVVIRQIIIQSLLNVFKINLQNMTKLHWETFWQFIDKRKIGKEFILYESMKVLIDRDNLIIFNPENIISLSKKMKNNLNWYNSKFYLDECEVHQIENNQCFLVDKTYYGKGVYVRNWKHGDLLFDNKSKKKKKISELFIKNKFSKLHKLIHPIVVDYKDNPIWIPNLRHSNCNNIKNKENIVIKWQQN